jgi:hypothetical protein
MQQPTIEIPDLFVAHAPGPCCRSLLRTLETKVPPLIVGRWKNYAVHGHFNGLLGVVIRLKAIGSVGRSGLSSRYEGRYTYILLEKLLFRVICCDCASHTEDYGLV